MQLLRWVVSFRKRRVADWLPIRKRNQSATLNCCVQLSCQELLSNRKLCNFIWPPFTRRKLCNIICQRLLSRRTLCNLILRPFTIRKLCNFIWRPFTRRKLCNFIWRPFTGRKLWIREWNQSVTLHCCMQLSCQPLISKRNLCNFFAGWWTVVNEAARIDCQYVNEINRRFCLGQIFDGDPDKLASRQDTRESSGPTPGKAASWIKWFNTSQAVLPTCRLAGVCYSIRQVGKIPGKVFYHPASRQVGKIHRKVLDLPQDGKSDWMAKHFPCRLADSPTCRGLLLKTAIWHM